MQPAAIAVFLLSIALLVFALGAFGLKLPGVDMTPLGLAFFLLAVLIREWPG
jgi:hypothetical protein